MSSFTKPLILKFLDLKKDRKRFQLIESFEYWRHTKDDNDIITIPAGYRTDFASVPRFFWRIIPPIGLYGKAAVIHDYLYDNYRARFAQYPATSYFRKKMRKECDLIFLEAMEVLGVSKWKRLLMYRAVRIGGPRF